MGALHIQVIQIIRPTVQLSTVAVFFQEGERTREEMTHFAGMVFVHCGGKPKAGELASSTATF